MHFDSLQGWLDWQESLHPQSIDLGLERADRVYRALNPQRIKPPTVTVAGTNGKGSCIAFLETIYREQGYRVGAYTSPHLLKYNERIKIDGQPVADETICEAFARIESVRGDTSLSYFEFGTLAALDIFWRSGVDVQLLEVGLGGRLDAVNIVDSDVALVTTICIDHCDWLGETREAIGREKAGIFRSGIRAVVGDPDPPASLLLAAAEKDTPLWELGKDFGYRKHEKDWRWYAPEQQLSELPFPALKGEHQFRNAASVLLALSIMQNKLPVSEKSIHLGLEKVYLAGRFQLVNAETPVILDVGHNPQAVRTLVDSLAEEFPGIRKHAVFSMMKDKDIKGVIDIMKPVVHDWCVAPLSNPRTAGDSLMREKFEECSVDAVEMGFSSFAEALAAARASAEKGDMILVFGSFFLVSEFLAGLNED